MATFDHEDKSVWYFGQIGREEAEQILREEKEVGVFLVRDSASCVGDFVLCVKEDTKVSHYIINKMQQKDQIVTYKIGTQVFPDIPNLLNFYKLHYLDTTALIRPASKKIEKVIGKFDFTSDDSEDLSFRKGEILTIIAKDEDQWWTARNSSGCRGSIPVPYVEKYEEGQTGIEVLRPGSGGAVQGFVAHAEAPIKKNQLQRQLPAKARVKQTRIPNAYDQTALKLEIGDVITVVQTNINGQWKGELNGKVGYFPFTHVEFLDENEES